MEDIVPIDPSWNLMSSKWVFKIKSDEHDHITRYRARLVAKGFLQREGVDYGDIFSPVVRYSTLRILLALAAHYGMFKRHLDCPKAFTQADLDTPCYMKPPPGMKVPSGFCLELVKSICGLKQASRLFHSLMIAFLQTLGFLHSNLLAHNNKNSKNVGLINSLLIDQFNYLTLSYKSFSNAYTSSPRVRLARHCILATVSH
jgi:hypothetical protein